MYSLIRPWGLEKNPNLINVGPTSIPEARVVCRSFSRCLIPATYSMDLLVQGAVNFSLKLAYSEHSMAKVKLNKTLKKHDQNYYIQHESLYITSRDQYQPKFQYLDPLHAWYKYGILLNVKFVKQNLLHKNKFDF